MEEAKLSTQKAASNLNQLIDDSVDQGLLAFAYENVEGLPDRQMVKNQLKENVLEFVRSLLEEERLSMKNVLVGNVYGYSVVTDQFAHNATQRCFETLFPIQDVKPAVKQE